ncbi:phage tail protein [Escherichia coli]
MRCMPVWNGQTLTFVQTDRRIRCGPITRSNVVMPDDGAPFRYSFSALKDRHNAVEVNWIDPDNGWETATSLWRTRRPLPVMVVTSRRWYAFGCTSRGRHTEPGCG